MIVISDELMTGAIVGAIGGVIRVAVGTVKIMFSHARINWRMTFAIAIGYALIGVLLGSVFSAYPSASLLAGFAGLDVVESVLKAFKTQKVVVTSNKVKGGIS